MKVLCDIVQVFRSIDSNSVKGFPKDPKDGTKRVSRKARFLSIKFSWFKYLFPVNDLLLFLVQNLVCGKNVLIDMSIHTAYIKAIRAAQHFIYIENQYFIGSSYNWNQYKDVGKNSLLIFLTQCIEISKPCH